MDAVKPLMSYWSHFSQISHIHTWVLFFNEMLSREIQCDCDNAVVFD